MPQQVHIGNNCPFPPDQSPPQTRSGQVDELGLAERRYPGGDLHPFDQAHDLRQVRLGLHPTNFHVATIGGPVAAITSPNTGGS